jgi:hypothetical protein
MSKLEQWIEFCEREKIPSMALVEVGRDDATTLNVGQQSPFLKCKRGAYAKVETPPYQLEDLSHMNPVSSKSRNNSVTAWWGRMSKAERQQAVRIRKSNAAKKKTKRA